MRLKYCSEKSSLKCFKNGRWKTPEDTQEKILLQDRTLLVLKFAKLALDQVPSPRIPQTFQDDLLKEHLCEAATRVSAF